MLWVGHSTNFNGSVLDGLESQRSERYNRKGSDYRMQATRSSSASRRFIHNCRLMWILSACCSHIAELLQF